MSQIEIYKKIIKEYKVLLTKYSFIDFETFTARELLEVDWLPWFKDGLIKIADLEDKILVEVKGQNG